MSAPGRLRRRLAIEAPQETPDGAGGVIRAFVATGGVWAEVVPLSLGESVAAGRALGVLSHRVVVRAGAGVTTAHRFRLGARVLRIAAVREADPAGRYLDCLCVEERP